jgi:uncharacterized protein (TIGR03792 family)
MVVELLRFKIKAELQKEFLEKNASIWTPALQQHHGFVDKEIWFNRVDPSDVYVAIHWETIEDWKSFPVEVSAELERQMGPEFQAVHGFELDVVMSTLRPVQTKEL